MLIHDHDKRNNEEGTKDGVLHLPCLRGISKIENGYCVMHVAFPSTMVESRILRRLRRMRKTINTCFW